MAGSPGSQPWLEALKKQAENKRERLATVLSKEAATPRRGWIRQLRVQKAQKFVDNRTRWAQAHLDNLKGLGHVLSDPAKGEESASASPSRGSLSD